MTRRPTLPQWLLAWAAAIVALAAGLVWAVIWLAAERMQGG